MKRKSIIKLVVALILSTILLVSSNFVYASSNNEISTMSYYGADTFTFYSVANKTNFMMEHLWQLKQVQHRQLEIQRQ